MPAAPELTLELLARRIRKLQQSGAIALILAAISLGLALQTYYRGLSLTEFAKRDDKTQTIRTDTINTRNLNIYNDGGKRVASFGAADLTPRISLESARGEVVALLSVGNDRRPSLILTDPQTGIRAVLDFKSNGAPSLRLEDPPNTSRLRLTSEGGPAVTLADPKGVVRWSVSADENDAHVRIFDASGKEVSPQP